MGPRENAERPLTLDRTPPACAPPAFQVPAALQATAEAQSAFQLSRVSRRHTVQCRLTFRLTGRADAREPSRVPAHPVERNVRPHARAPGPRFGKPSCDIPRSQHRRRSPPCTVRKLQLRWMAIRHQARFTLGISDVGMRFNCGRTSWLTGGPRGCARENELCAGPSG